MKMKKYARHGTNARKHTHREKGLPVHEHRHEAAAHEFGVRPIEPKVTINGRHLNVYRLTFLCATIAAAQRDSKLATRNKAIHDLAKFIGVGAATNATEDPE